MISASSSFLSANAALAKQPIYALEIDGYTRIFTNRDTGVADHYPWIVKIADHAVTVEDLEGSSSLGDLNVQVLDYQRQFTADLPSFTFEGKVARLKTGFLGMGYADYVTLFTGLVTTVPVADANSYTITCQDTRLDLRKVIYTAGDDGQPTSSDHPKTVIGNPMDILLSVLETYLGIATGDVDVAKITAYRDQVFAGMTFEFEITTAPEAKDWLEKQIFKPLGGYLRVDAFGKVTVQFFVPLPGTGDPVMTLDRTKIVGIPLLVQADLKNVVTMRFDHDGDKWLSESVQIDSASTDRYGQQGQQIIEAEGVRSAFQGFSIAAQTASAIFNRYGNKNPSFELPALWSAVLLEPGDLVLVTHSLMPDRAAGTMGITAKTFEVLNRTWNFTEGTVTLQLVDGTGATIGGRFRIAPDDTADWTVADSSQKQTYMFVSGADGKYSDATDGNKLA